MWVADGIRSYLVMPAIASPAIIRGCHKEGVERTARKRVQVKCNAQEVDIPDFRKVSQSVKGVERGRDELVVLSCTKRVAGFESAAHQLEISLQQLKLLPSTQLQLTSGDGVEEELTRRHEKGSPKSTLDESPLPRRKRVWHGVRRQRRMPPQPPWSADDFTRKAQLMMETILSESGEGRVLVDEVLDSWLRRITRVELTRVIKDLGFRKQPSLALEVFSWMQRQKGRLKPTPHAYCSVVGMLGRAGMVSKAREIFDCRDLKSLESVRLYNAMMGAYVRSGNFERAWKLYEDLCERGLEADEVTFNTLLSGVSGADMPLKTTQKLFSKMKHLGISPSVYTYNTLIMAFSQCGNLKGAAAILEEMRSANKTPDLCTFNTVISMYGRAGRHEEALQVFNILRAAGVDPDVVTHTSLIQMFSRAQNVDAAVSLFSEMQRVGCTPDVMTYSLLVHMYGRAGRTAEAQEVFEEMQEAGFKPNVVTWSSLIQAYSRKGMLDKVGSCFVEMQNSGCQPDASLFNTMMNAYKQAGLPIHAATLFRSMQSQGIAPNAACFNTLIHAFSESGQRQDAKALHEQMVRAGFAPDKRSRRFINNLSSHRDRGKHEDTFQL